MSQGGDVWGRVDLHVAGERRVLVATGYERQSQMSRRLPGNFTAERNAGNAFPEDASRLISEHNPPTHPYPQAHPSKKHSEKPQRAFANRRTFASIQLDSGC